MANGKVILTVDNFCEYMRGQPERLAWFTKPEIAIKQRVREYVNEKKVE